MLAIARMARRLLGDRTMHPAAQTQPLAAPWRRASKAARLHISFERVASLVVEDQRCPVSRLHAQVFEVELIARLIMTTADGGLLEKRVITARDDDGDLFARRVIDTVEWADTQHPGLAMTMTHDLSPVWCEVISALFELRADLDDRVSRAPVPAQVHLDRRPRVG